MKNRINVLMADLSHFCCWNSQCPDYSKTGVGNLSITSRYGPDQERRMLRCRTCKTRFSERKGTPLFGAHLDSPTAESVLGHLVEGRGIREAGRLSGVHRDTVARYRRLIEDQVGSIPRLKMKRKVLNVALFLETSHSYARETLHGIRSYVREHGPWKFRFSEQGRGVEPPPWLARWKGDGILARMENDRLARAIDETGLPVVDVSCYRLLRTMPSVEPDPVEIARLAVDHLLERGLKHFGFCGVPGVPWSDLRGSSFARSLAEAGHDCHLFRRTVVQPISSSWNIDKTAIARWIRSLPKPVGILGAWDGCALQVLEVCRNLNVAVPDEVAVLGVDNDDLLCDLADPSLSSIKCSAHQIGYHAASLLGQMMAGADVPPDIAMVRPAGVVARQSTDLFAIDDHLVSDALRFIRDHACEGIQVCDVLKIVPLSRRVLETRFKSAVGYTPHEAIVRLQLRSIKELLTETNLSLATIATKSGFNHLNYMCKLFKQKTGFTPGEYRARNRSKG
ncbi:transcriptional regulator, AraC family [Singulisphaera sp. GP187]|nr:transcriptional regulator, AraC family [Singulisphaera sp. GP187]